MANYYDTLKVSTKASGSEIKSAYRRLARKLHPDNNNGSEKTARAFAEIAEAYEVLGNSKERSLYDQRLLSAQFNSTADSETVFSSNTHARKWRQMVYEHRYNEIIDRMVADERRDAIALQKVIFPTVGLFASMLIVGISKPQIFANSVVVGKIIVISLFIAGVIHLYGRIREGLERFTYDDASLHESILDDNEPVTKPYSRFTAGSFLAAGVCASFAVGLLIGNYLDFVTVLWPNAFSDSLKPEFVFYPPIVVLFVDIMHSLAMRIEG